MTINQRIIELKKQYQEEEDPNRSLEILSLIKVLISNGGVKHDFFSEI